MKATPLPLLIAACLCTVSAPAALAGLPQLNKAPWFGHFSAFEDRNSRFTFSADGKVEIRPIVDKEMLGATYTMRIGLGVRETLPDGKVFMRWLEADSLESEQPASDKFERFTVRGKTKDGIAAEILIERHRNGYRLGGRLVDPPQDGAKRHDFVILTRFDDFYRHSNTESKTFKQKTEDDELELRLVDGKRERLPLGEKLADPAAAKAQDIREFELSMHGLRGKSIAQTTSDRSKLRIEEDEGEPMNKGFRMVWSTDADQSKGITEWMEVVIK